MEGTQPGERDGRITDPGAFEAVFRVHFPPVYRFIARRVGAALAEDLAAETFAIAYRRRAIAGLLPALKAARMAPTQALWTL
jgi:DNA-directed RNA polymerase specialized sigma24 family protein